MSPTRHRHSLSKPALARRRKDRVPCPAPADHSEAIFFPRRCTFARRKSPSRHMRPSGHDNGLPLCDVALFQTAAIANSLANKPAISREALQLKAASRAASLRSQVGSGRSVRSNSSRSHLDNNPVPAAHLASQKRLLSGEKVLSGHTHSATYAVCFLPNGKQGTVQC
ncbi:hypothetical protein FAVG1_09092 [Fusarium avenaceum]|nr:hypothetical protein FAVG1_09092 [Fusarium avenaceum]